MRSAVKLCLEDTLKRNTPVPSYTYNVQSILNLGFLNRVGRLVAPPMSDLYILTRKGLVYRPKE